MAPIDVLLLTAAALGGIVVAGVNLLRTSPPYRSLGFDREDSWIDTRVDGRLDTWPDRSSVTTARR